MKLITLAEVDSTSLQAQRHIRQGEPLPFAVGACTQSSGIGRRGKSWISPIGGIYLSVAHQAHDLAHWPVTSLSLYAGIAVCAWINETTGCKPRLKWPNDIVFAGRKLAGVLCQAQSRGQQIEAVIIGFGINIERDIDGPAYKTVCMADLSRERLARPSELRNHFLNFWECFSKQPAIYVEQLLTSYQLPPGQLWQKKTPIKHQKYWIHSSIQPDSSLSLLPCSSDETQKKITLTSAHHDYLWSYQQHKPVESCPLIVGDIGNSSLKIGVFSHPHDKHPQNLFTLDLRNLTTDSDLENSRQAKDLSTKIREYLPVGANTWPIFLASVNAPGLRLSQLWAHQCGLQPFCVQKTPVRRRDNSPYHINILGIDRLAMQESWLAQAAPDDWAILVSLGTITVVDLIDGHGIHHGGYLVPGIQSALSTMWRQTSDLPKLLTCSISHIDRGHHTESAMQNGVIAQTVALIIAAQTQAHRQYQSSPDIVLSGGWAKHICPHLSEAKLRPSAIIDGIRRLVLGG